MAKEFKSALMNEINLPQDRKTVSVLKCTVSKVYCRLFSVCSCSSSFNLHTLYACFIDSIQYNT